VQEKPQNSKPDISGPELVIGLVGAIGTDLDMVQNELSEALQRVNYKSTETRLSRLLRGIPGEYWSSLPERSEVSRLRAHMEAGNRLREILERGDALALLGVLHIRHTRRIFSGDPSQPIPRRAYILRSLKRPEEVKTLRQIYGSAFVLLSAYCPRSLRRDNLCKRIARDQHATNFQQFSSQAEELMHIDETEEGKPYGQNVLNTFWRADVFVNASDSELLRPTLARFVQLFFGHPFETPTADEYGMFHAYAAALRSAALGRQVGAVIATREGDIVAVGTNEVPRPGGGLYWSDSQPDHRDFREGFDISDRMRQHVLGDILQRLQKLGWLEPQIAAQDITQLVNDALTGANASYMRRAIFMSLIEFGRTVHAEMAALSDAARRGVSVHSCTLYTSTFPCHDCARHIVASGISRVVYIEPYPKSLVPDLYHDSIALDTHTDQAGSRVPFEPFVGVAPPRYIPLFTMVEPRKTREGNIVHWEPSRASPRLEGWSPEGSRFWEGEACTEFEAQMLRKSKELAGVT
jgi:deoxycytidylate deaminase